MTHFFSAIMILFKLLLLFTDFHSSAVLPHLSGVLCTSTGYRCGLTTGPVFPMQNYDDKLEIDEHLANFRV